MMRFQFHPKPQRGNTQFMIHGIRVDRMEKLCRASLSTIRILPTHSLLHQPYVIYVGSSIQFTSYFNYDHLSVTNYDRFEIFRPSGFALYNNNFCNFITSTEI